MKFLKEYLKFLLLMLTVVGAITLTAYIVTFLYRTTTPYKWTTKTVTETTDENGKYQLVTSIRTEKKERIYDHENQ